MEERKGLGDEGMKNKCNYCGERKARVKISDPNGGLGEWDVCLICETVIDHQKRLSLGHILNSKKMIDNANTELERISKETGAKIFTSVFKLKESAKK